LRVIKPPSLTQLATIGIPTLGMIALFLLPFYDRRPERRPERRPIAMVTFVVVVGAMRCSPTRAPMQETRRRSHCRRRPPS